MASIGVASIITVPSPLFLDAYFLVLTSSSIVIFDLIFTGVNIGEEVVLEMFDLFFELLACLWLEAIEQVLFQVVECLDLGGAVASANTGKYLDELAPLLRLSENEDQRVEKFS